MSFSPQVDVTFVDNCTEVALSHPSNEDIDVLHPIMQRVVKIDILKYT